MKMQFSYQQYCKQMNRVYFSVYNWPQPYQYHQWFNSLPPDQQAMTVHPHNYTQIYAYNMQPNSLNNAQIPSKPPPLSRNQKRKQKKKELLQELEKQKQAIGNWVRLQRKDLYQSLEKIEKRQQKIRKKKEGKLKHLIEINKQVSKHYSRRQTNKRPINRRVQQEKTKKRISYVKKLKQVFDKNKYKFIGLSGEEQEWQSDKQQQKLGDKLDNEKLQKLKNEVKEITYNSVSKLTGVKHNNMVLRQWVRNCPSEKLDDLVLRVVNRLAYKQAIRRVQKPDKARKLIVSGLKECKRTINTIIDKKRSKILIVALNIERNPYKGGVDDQVQTIIEQAQKIKIPIIHACSRSHLGRAFTGKWGPRVTMVSIINFEGYQDNIDEVLQEWQKASAKYDAL